MATAKRTCAVADRVHPHELRSPHSRLRCTLRTKDGLSKTEIIRPLLKRYVAVKNLPAAPRDLIHILERRSGPISARRRRLSFERLPPPTRLRPTTHGLNGSLPSHRVAHHWSASNAGTP